MFWLKKSLWVILIMSIWVGVSPGNAQNSNVTALINGTVIDGTGADPIADAVIVIEDGRITAVGPAADVNIPAQAEVIDVQGATILPSFFNTHVHDGYTRIYLTNWVQAGVTTVRDLGVHNSLAWSGDDLPPLPEEADPLRALLRKAFAIRDLTRDNPQYARLVAAGPFINTPGGYGGVVYPAETPDGVQQAVDDVMSLGADSIKTALDDGRIIGQHYPVYSPEEFAALVDAAHAHDVPVSLHIMYSEPLPMAMEAGVDEIVHMAVDTLTDEIIALAVENDVYWVPTLELWHGVSNAHPVSYDTVAQKNLKQFVDAGGKVALGTDFHGYFTPFDEGMPITEITLMHEAGMTPMQIIVAATQHAAEVCQLADDLGTLEPGKIADILVVDGDPLTDLNVLLNVQWVLRDGVIVRAP